MKILSIDVGIKNLAFCLFDKSIESPNFKITKWDIINLSDNKLFPCSYNENNIGCDKQAKFKKDGKYYCCKHSKKQAFLIPTNQQTPNFIGKQKLEKLYEIADNLSISFETKIKKTNLVQLINEHIKKVYLDSIEDVKSNEMNLYNIGKNIKCKMNEMFVNETEIDYVIIENQIGPLAVRMKTIQGMILQYFIMSHINVEKIEFVSASNKLKDCNAKEKANYSDRKKLGIAKCLGILTSDFRFNEHLTYFNTHKKKDDLSDAFLQGMWFIDKNKL
jgi:hypothetical protein